ncbi:cysteine peroxiredoxin [Mrakia frigida]|uniref:peroxiredoxin n=1 Tax=Mrakia frigida TaxID=29902 RepID=UPI003FCC0A16
MAPPLRLGSLAPDFEAQTYVTLGPIKFSEFCSDSWVVLFSHPGDFTPVCTTELGEVSKLEEEWKKRNIKVVGLSADSVKKHQAFVKDINEVSKSCLSYPLIGDADRRIASLYSMLDGLDDTNRDEHGLPMTVRTVFVLDTHRVIRLMLSYPASTGREFVEILRVIDSLQVAEKYKVSTPVNWKKGDPLIIHPSVSDEEARTLFPGFTTTKPYLRFTTREQAAMLTSGPG